MQIFYTKYGLSYWNMTLKCKNVSFYTTNRNFKIRKKLLIFLKSIAFFSKSA